jgi:DNA-binding response OmpR family regulator
MTHCGESLTVAIDPVDRTATIGEQVVRLTPTELSTLLFVVSQPDRTLTREELIAGAHGSQYPATARSIDLQIMSLRRKLRAVAGQLETVRGQGYRFRTQPNVRWDVK